MGRTSLLAKYLINTSNILLDVNTIPTEWVFQFFLGLEEPLAGENIMVSSPFAEDPNPSFSVFKPKGKDLYRWCCFSSGWKGDVVDLIARLKAPTPAQPIPRLEASRLLKEIYLAKKDPGYKPKAHLPNSRGRVTKYEVRKWEMRDTKFWGAFEITINMCRRYNVAPLAWFEMEKMKSGILRTFVFTGLIYGYFTADGQLAKIYRPGEKKGKFIKVLEAEWIQGMDQLRYETDELIIHSSMKENMCFLCIGFEGEYEVVAPDSENILISPGMMTYLKSRYKRIRGLFDNDTAGRKAAALYQEVYQAEPIFFEMSKDVSDSARDYSGSAVRIKLLQIL